MAISARIYNSRTNLFDSNSSLSNFENSLASLLTQIARINFGKSPDAKRKFLKQINQLLTEEEAALFKLNTVSNKDLIALYQRYYSVYIQLGAIETLTTRSRHFLSYTNFITHITAILDKHLSISIFRDVNPETQEQQRFLRLCSKFLTQDAALIDKLLVAAALLHNNQFALLHEVIAKFFVPDWGKENSTRAIILERIEHIIAIMAPNKVVALPTVLTQIITAKTPQQIQDCCQSLFSETSFSSAPVLAKNK